MNLAAPAVALFTEDCLTGMRARLADGEVDTVITSPPYNRGVGYGTYNDNRSQDDYLNWMDEVGGEIHRVLSDRGSFFLNLGGSPQDPWKPWEVAQRLRGRFVLQNHIVWVKSLALATPAGDPLPGLGEHRSLGHYKPINSPRYLNGGYEFVFHFTKTGDVPLDRLAVGVPYQDKSNVARWGAVADRRCRGNVWFVPYPTDRKSVV